MAINSQAPETLPVAATTPPAGLTGRWRATREQVRRVWALTRPYFTSEQKFQAWLLLGAIVALNLGTVYLSVLLNEWRRVFYDALQEKNATVFWQQLWRFLYLALTFVVASIYTFYLTQLLTLRWRSWMTHKYLEQWLSNQRFYRIELGRFQPASGAALPQDNPDQRIQEDIAQFTSTTIGLSMGLLNSVVSLGSFVGILWALSGNFDFHFNGQGYYIPGFMVWVVVLYCLFGSVVTHYIGRPQIALNFQLQRVEADFRHRMVRVREFSEAIALERGEAVENAQLGSKFRRIFANQLALIQAQKRLYWFSMLFGQVASIFPILVSAPRYFSGAIQLGGLMQIASAFSEVQSALNWFVDNYQSLAGWRATTDRLTSFSTAIGDAPALLRSSEASAEVGVESHDLEVALPGASPLLQHVNVRLAAGDTVLLTGPSGSGKSSLLRSLAGVWPYASGALELAADTMFLPQTAYFPEGLLRDALAYPEPAAKYSDEQLQEALREALLPQLCDQLDRTSSWSHQLSGGEQQRLSIARVLLKQPRWVFADEATSALDAPAEAHLYQRLGAMVARRQGGLLSVAHRAEVASFHQKHWSLQPQPGAGVAPFCLSQ